MKKKRPANTTSASASWLRLSLTRLEGHDWGDPEYDSYVVRTVHELRRKPIGELTDEELRLALRQQVGLKYLVPLALDRLNEDPFRSGDFHEGDVLVALLGLPADFWVGRGVWREALRAVAAAAVNSLQGIGADELDEAYAEFMNA
jgi:hypothetical protein